jgi:hypothetical protein
MPDIAVLQLIVDGEPMELDMQSRTGRIPGAGPLPYVGHGGYGKEHSAAAHQQSGGPCGPRHAYRYPHADGRW